MKKAQLVFLEQLSDSESRMTVLAECFDPSTAEQFKEAGRAAAVKVAEGCHSARISPSLGKSGKKVVVVQVEDERVCPSGIKVGDVYDSATQLSFMLGFRYNACAQAFGASKRKGATQATLRGVTFEYQENTGQ